MLLGSIRSATVSLLSDRASRLIAGLGLSVVVCLVLLGGYLCADLRAGAWHNAERNADNLLALIEEGVGRNIGLYDLSLSAAARLAARPDVAALPPDMRRLVLFDQTTRASGLGTIAITDAEGRTRLTNDPDQEKRPDFGDRAAFRTHRDDPNAGLIIAGPLTSALSGHTVMALSRRINDPDGAFAGIAAGTVHLDYFQSLFARLRIEEGSALNIFHRDGTLLVRAPFDAAFVGRSIAQGETYPRFRAEERGRFVGRAAIDGTGRLYAFANIAGLPLFVTVAVSADSVRATWIYKAGIVALLVLGLSALTFGLTLLLQREVRHRAEQEASARAANAALALLAQTDSLTGLPNRRRYDELLAGAWQRAALTGGPLALLIVDADRFKRFNDHFGHQVGDDVLRAVARSLRRHLAGAGATACRIGGEEFAVILPDTTADAAHAVAERIRLDVADRGIPHAPDVGGVATVSIGLAHRVPAGFDGPETLFAEADAALYEAKRAGRNRVRAAPTGAAVPLARSA